MSGTRAPAQAHRAPLFTAHRARGAVMCLFLVLAAMPSLKLSDSPLVTFSDVVLILGIGVLAPTLLVSRLRLPGLYAVGALTIIVMGMLSCVLEYEPASFQGLFRLVYALVFIPAIFALWQPSQRMTAALAFSYGLGTCISVFDGLISGPGPDGRTVGLTTHPNALGISCLLTLALLRYTGHVLPRLRPALWVVGIIATYGIWLSGSRGALAAAAFLALVVTIAERSVAGTLGLGVAFAGLLVTVGYVNNSRSNNALARILGGGTSSDASGQRHKAFETALSQINDHPLFGAGFVHIREAQSVLLQVPAALGLIALLGFLAILVSLMLPLVTRPAPLRYLAYPTIAYLALAVTTDSVSDTVVWGPLSLCMIAAVRVANRSPDDTTPAAVPIGDQIRPSEAR